MTKAGSIIGHRIDYNGVGAWGLGPAAHTQQKLIQVPHPGFSSSEMLQTTGSKYVKVMMPDGFLLTALGTSHYTFRGI